MNLPHKFYKHLTIISLGTAVLLIIPLIGMQFTNEINWSLFDFIVAGVLFLGSGLTYEFVSHKMEAKIYRVAVGIAVVASLLLIWVNLAVGIIGSEKNPVNFLYEGVILVGFLGGTISGLKPKGMETTLFVMAIAQLLIPVFALIAWNPESDSLATLPNILRVFCFNLFFAMMFFGSALLFKKVSRQKEIAANY